MATKLIKTEYNNKDGKPKDVQTPDTKVSAWDMEQIVGKVNEVIDEAAPITTEQARLIALFGSGETLSKLNPTLQWGLKDGVWAEVVGGGGTGPTSDPDNMWANQFFVDSDSDGIADGVTNNGCTMSLLPAPVGNYQKMLSPAGGVNYIDLTFPATESNKLYRVSFNHKSINGDGTGHSVHLKNAGGGTVDSIASIPDSIVDAEYIEYIDRSTVVSYRPFTRPVTDSALFISNFVIKDTGYVLYDEDNKFGNQYLWDTDEDGTPDKILTQYIDDGTLEMVTPSSNGHYANVMKHTVKTDLTSIVHFTVSNTVVNQQYTLTFLTRGITTGTLRPLNATSDSGQVMPIVTGDAVLHTYTFTATAISLTIRIGDGSGTSEDWREYSNLIVKEVI